MLHTKPTFASSSRAALSTCSFLYAFSASNIAFSNARSTELLRHVFWPESYEKNNEAHYNVNLKKIPNLLFD